MNTIEQKVTVRSEPNNTLPTGYRYVFGTRAKVRTVTTTTSTLVVLPNVDYWLDRATKKINSLPESMVGSGEPPNEWALQTARKIALNLQDRWVKPSRIIAIASGGVCFVFERDGRESRIDIENDGAIVVVTGEQPSPTYAMAPAEQAAALIAKNIRAA